MNIKRVLIVALSIVTGLLLCGIGGIVIWLNYTPIVEYDYEELQYVEINYLSDDTNRYEKITVEEPAEMKRIYDTVKSARLEYVSRFAGDVLGGDSKWYIIMHFEDGSKVDYDADPELVRYEYGCRRYRMDEKNPGQIEAMIIISSKELYDLMDEYIPE